MFYHVQLQNVMSLPSPQILRKVCFWNSCRNASSSEILLIKFWVENEVNIKNMIASPLKFVLGNCQYVEYTVFIQLMKLQI